MGKLMIRLFAVAILAAGCGDDESNADSGTPDGSSIDSSGNATVFNLTLTTEDEEPVCKNAGKNAMGTGTVTISADESTIDVNIEFSGLSGDPTMAHIHFGPTDMAGPAIFPFTDLESPIVESFTAADYPAAPPKGAPADFAAFIDAMNGGMTYVNIHTADCMPGEIRSQIE